MCYARDMEECLTFNFISKNPTYSIQDIVSVLSQCMCYSCNAPRVIGNFSEAQRDSVGTSDRPVVDAESSREDLACAEEPLTKYVLSSPTVGEMFFGEKGQLLTHRDGKLYVLSTPAGKQVRHGTASTCETWGCRCEDCVEARRNREFTRRKENPTWYAISNRRKNERAKAKRQFAKATAFRTGIAYTEQEDALLLSQPISLALALEMGRTMTSLRNRKTSLRNTIRAQGIDPNTMQPLDNN